MDCELCGHAFSQKHRVLPGIWGGHYEPGNVVHFCPNHHSAIHYIMSWYYKGAHPKKVTSRLLSYIDDRPLWVFWLDRVRPLVQERMGDEGRWKPHFRAPFPYPAPSGEQKRDWIARDKQSVRDDDARYRVNMDAAYTVSHFGDHLAEMNPEDLRRDPFYGRMEPTRFATLIGYLIGSRKFHPGNGYAGFVVVDDKE